MARELNDNLRYARRKLPNGATHYCIQNTETGEIIKHPLHGMRPFIRHDEIPTGVTIHEFVEVSE